MAERDMQPLVQSPRWSALAPPKREELLRLWRDPGTSDSDRQYMLRSMQESRAPEPGAVPDAVTPATPSPWQALLGAFKGEQRFPGQAGAPPEGVNIADIAETRMQESPFGQVVAPATRFVTGAVTEPANIGQVAGTALVPGPYKPFAGAGGAIMGEGYRQWRAGEPFDASKMLKEGALTLLPEVFESAGRAAVKTAARGTTSGKALMREEAAQQGREVPATVFEPRPAADISQAFETVRRAGVQIDSADVIRRMQTMPPGKQVALLDEIAWIDQHNRTGGRYTEMLENLRKPSTSNTVDLGQLQDLRSQLRQRAQALPEGEARQLLRDFQAVVDATIFQAPATGARAHETRAVLAQARQDWARRMAADDMSDMIENKISSSPDLSSVSLNLAGLYDELRRGRSEISRTVDRAIDLMPGGRQRFEAAMEQAAQQFQYVNLPKVPGMQQALSVMMLNPTLREALRGAIVQGRGTVSPNTFAMLLNAARREMFPERTDRTSDRESAYAPGGPARTTD